jgi:hypothetical protein
MLGRLRWALSGGGPGTETGPSGAFGSAPAAPGRYWSTARKKLNPFSSAIRCTPASGEMIDTRLPSRCE